MANSLGYQLELIADFARTDPFNFPIFRLINTSTLATIESFSLTIGDTAFNFDNARVNVQSAGTTVTLISPDRDGGGGVRSDILSFAFGGFTPGSFVEGNTDIDIDNINSAEDFRQVLFDLNGSNSSDNAVVTVTFDDGTILSGQLPDFSQTANDVYTFSQTTEPSIGFTMTLSDDFNSPLVRIVNTSSFDEIVDFVMTIGDQNFNFDSAGVNFRSSFVSEQLLSPDFDFGGGIRSDELSYLFAKFGPGGILQSRVDIDKDNFNSAEDYRQILFDLNGSDDSDNSVITVTFSSGVILSGKLPDFTQTTDEVYTFSLSTDRFINPDNGHIYFLTDPKLGTSWTEAEAQAVAAGGHLVTINDANEQAWINNTFNNFVNFNGSFVRESFWIGLYDPQGDNTDEWVNGEAVTYTNWAAGEPNSSSEQYVELNPLFAPNQWNDRRNEPFPGLGGRGIVEIIPTITVDTLIDENDGNLSSGDVSLREALAFITDGGTITFATDLANQDVGFGQGTIGLTLGALNIDKSLEIKGLGSDLLTIDARGLSRVFFVRDIDPNSFSDVVIDGLTITGGNQSQGNGAGIFNSENLMVSNSHVRDNTSDFGGGLRNLFGNMQVVNTTVSNNSATGSGGGIDTFGGSLEVIRSVFYGNTAGQNGGGIVVGLGDANVINSTFSGNIATARGGGISLGQTNLTITNTTIFGNTALIEGGGINSFPSGGTTISNSIIAGSTNNQDVSGSFISEGYNLVGDVTGSSGWISNDQVGTTTNPIDPGLTPLLDIGGSTLVHGLLSTSPARDAGDPNFSPPLNTDQRGLSRIADGDGDGNLRIDIGAFEAQTPNLIIGELEGTDGNDSIVVLDSNDPVAGLLGNDYIFGSDGDDVLRGDLNNKSSQVGIGGDDVIYGGAGNDRIGGKGGNDTIFGDEGNDQIWGDDGDDLLRGGLGNDKLTGDDRSGGQGSDIFVVAAGEGTDTITDFELGVDFIGLAGSLTYEDLTIDQQRRNAILSYNSETLAILNRVNGSDLTRADFITV